MEKKVIWYCTGCEEKCAVKISGGYSPVCFRGKCLLFSVNFCSEQGYKPDWRKHKPEAK